MTSASRLLLVIPLLLALASCEKPKQAIDYGPLGPPTKDEIASFKSFDPAIETRTPEDTIALFRKNEANGPQGTEDRPVKWDELQEHEAYQRALFYRAAEAEASLITDNDWKLVRAEERDEIQSICDNWTDSSPPSFCPKPAPATPPSTPAPTAAAPPAAEAPPEDLPKEVKDFNDAQSTCVHFTMEQDTPETRKAMQDLKCDSLPAVELELRRKYSNNPAVLKSMDIANEGF